MNPTRQLITRAALPPLGMFLIVATASAQASLEGAAEGRRAPPVAAPQAPVATTAPAADAPQVNPAVPAAPVTAAPPAVNDAATNSAVTLPSVEVNDPMLTPNAPPPRVLNDWREALRLVRNRSTSLRAAELTVTRARVQALATTNRFLPTLRATGTVTHPLLSPGTSANAFGNFQNFQTTWRGTVSLRQPIVNFQTWHDAETADIAIEATELSQQDIERRILAGVADTIVTVVTAERLAEVSRVNLRGALSTLDLTERRARLGAASSVDVLRAQQEVTLLRQRIVTSDENLARAREALGMALGYPEPWGVSSNIRLNDLAVDAARVCTQVGDVSQRADVRALRKQQEVAERNIASADYQLAPTLDFTSDYTYSQPNFPADAKPMQWSIGALLTIPIYDGGARGAQRWQQQTIALETQNQIDQRTREAILEARQAIRAVEVARRNYEVSVESRRLAQETARLAQLSFFNGRGTSFELVEAARRSQEAELDLAVKEFDLVRAQLSAQLAQANCNL
jgi:outer membrane protein TolC